MTSEPIATVREVYDGFTTGVRGLGTLRKALRGDAHDAESVRINVEARHIAEVDATQLRKYSALCGIDQRGGELNVPITYHYVLSHPAVMSILLDRKFPAPAPGVLHVSYEITQLLPVYVGDKLSVHAKCDTTRPHPKGVLADFRIRFSRGDDCVTEMVSTLLLPQRKRSRSAASGTRPKRDARPSRDTGVGATRVIYADPKVIRKYSLMAGDFNPIHLSAAIARMMGMPGLVAQGAWTAAQLLSTSHSTQPAPDFPRQYRVHFRSPLPASEPIRVQVLPPQVGTKSATLTATTADGSRLCAEAEYGPIRVEETEG